MKKRGRKKEKFIDRYYHFLVSSIITSCVLSLVFSMYISYYNTRKLAFGENIPLINIYREVDGDIIFMFNEQKYKIQSPIEKQTLNKINH